MRKSLSLIVILLSVWFTTSVVVQAQDDTLTDTDFQELCQAFVDASYAQLSSNCANVPEGTACYGFNGSLAFLEIDGAVSPDFVDPAQQQVLLDLEATRTELFDFLEEVWGIVLVNVDANLPVALPGRRGTFLLFGEVRTERDTENPDVVELPDTPVSLNATGADLYNFPPGYEEPSQIVGTAPSTPLQADVISPDGEWLRVYFIYQSQLGERASAWVQLSDVQGTIDTSTLPVMGPEDRTIMQDYYLINGFQTPDCEATPPNMILVQGPNGIEMDTYVNDAPIRTTGVSLLRVIDGEETIEVDNEQIYVGRTLEIFVLSGFAQVRPGGTIVPAGHKAFICLEGPEDRGIDDQVNDLFVTDDCPWSGAVRASREELDFFNEFIEGKIPGVSVPDIFVVSGIGGPVIELRLEDLADLVIFRQLCEQGILPPEICEAVNL